MSNRSIVEKVQRHIGGVIACFCVEFWACETEEPARPISVGIGFRDGGSFIFSCAGDGTVAVRKGRLEVSAENLQLRALDEFCAKVLESVEFGDDTVVLSLAGQHIRIANHDDQLEVRVNDYDVKEFLGNSEG